MSSSIRRLERVLPRGLMLLLLSAGGIATSSAASAASFELPPLNAPVSHEHHAGKIVWADLVTPDLAVAERFYGALFGWTFQTVHSGEPDYAIALADGVAVGGILQKPIAAGEHRQSAWLTFFAVHDVNVSTRDAVAHGATILADTKSYPMRGRQAVLADSEGAVFAILVSSSGDAPDFLARTGEWIWSSLLCQDPDTEAAFYQEMIGYDVFDLASEDGLTHLILSSDNYARASVNSFPADSKRRHAHWLNFVRVASTADMLAKVVAAGGRVLVEPHVDRQGGLAAVVADPAGAPFGLMEWTAGDSKVEPR